MIWNFDEFGNGEMCHPAGVQSQLYFIAITVSPLWGLFTIGHFCYKCVTPLGFNCIYILLLQMFHPSGVQINKIAQPHRGVTFIAKRNNKIPQPHRGATVIAKRNNNIPQPCKGVTFIAKTE